MISAKIKPGYTPRLLAVFSFRHDAHLVPSLIANIAPMVDGWVSYDDRASTEVFSNEVQRRTALLQAARELGASWALAVDPDERFDTRLAGEIRALTQASEANAISFALREMYARDTYRVDGIWGGKRQVRLLRIADGVLAPEGHLHLSWAAFIPGARIAHADFNLYHLKMITPERRRARAALYNHLDPERRMQKMGYDYLADDAGAEFARIGHERAYFPAHREDGGLWMPQVSTAAS
jgi:hypothetical protein